MIQQIIINSIISTALYILISSGFWISYRVSKYFNFSHAATFAISGYSMYAITVNRNYPNGLAVLWATCITIIIAYSLDRIIFMPARTRAASPTILMIMSLGVYIFLQSAMALLFGEDNKNLWYGNVSLGIKVFNARISNIQVVIVVSAIMIVIILRMMDKCTKYGLASSAVSKDKELARISGINYERVMGFTNIICSTLGSVAGILIGLDLEIEPTMGLGTMLVGLVVVIVGGTRNILNMVCVAILLSAAQDIAVWYINSQWMDSIALLMLMIYLIIQSRRSTNLLQ